MKLKVALASFWQVRRSYEGLVLHKQGESNHVI